MTIASLVVGICGVVLASLSLGWQAANYILTGGRIRVTLAAGAVGNGGVVTVDPSRFNPEQLSEMAAQGFTSPVATVKVANVGRQPVTVARWGLTSARGVSLYPVAMSIGPSLPHRLEVGAAETWMVDFIEVAAFLHATEHTRRSARRLDVVAEVELADGRTRRSDEAFR